MEPTNLGPGYTGITVSATRSRKMSDGGLLSYSVGLDYSLGAPHEAADVVEPYSSAHAFADSLAAEQLKQAVAEYEVTSATQALAPITNGAATQPTPQATSPQGLVVGSKPNNQGQLRFVPTSALPPKSFIGKIADGIRQLGFDSQQFAIFDNREELEQGKAAWSVARVIAGQGSPWEGAMTKDGKARTAFYVDFDDAGQVLVKPSKDMEQAQQMMASFQQQQAQAAPAPQPAPAGAPTQYPI